MVSRPNPKLRSAGSILNECDRVERKASSSAERAAREIALDEVAIVKARAVVTTYEEAQLAFDAAMQERLDLELAIEALEKAHADAIIADAEAAEALHIKLVAKRKAVILAH